MISAGERRAVGFQSPRPGKFESNTAVDIKKVVSTIETGFNPLDRGNLNQIGDYKTYQR